MSDRLITAQEARELIADVTPEGWAIWEDLHDGGFVHVGDTAGVIPEGEVSVPDGVEVNPVAKVYIREDAEMIAAAPGLASTVIAQAEQIKRLQKAVKELSREMEGYRPHEVAWVELTHDDIFKFEDMEDTDE